jgi:signal transduction histidine kinase
MASFARRFVSMSWRLTLPLTAVVAVVGTFGVFFIVSALTAARVNLAAQLGRQSAEAALSRLDERFEQLRSEAARVAYAHGVAEALQTRAVSAIEPGLRSLMWLGQLDVITLLNAAGSEVLTLRRDGEVILTSVNADLDQEMALARLLTGSSAEALVLGTSEAFFVVVGVPIVANQQVIGAALVGQTLSAFADSLNVSSFSDVILYAPDGTLLTSTHTAASGELLPESTRRQTLEGAVVSLPLRLGEELYEGVAVPLRMGRSVLGTLVVVVPSAMSTTGVDSRPLVAGLAALMAVSAVVTLAMGSQRAAQRLETVAETAYAVASGHSNARTHMQPVDEIGRVGHAVDAMARVAQHREDQLRAMLTRERRERAYLMHVMESLPGGVLLYAVSGQLLMMNNRARALLAGQPLALPAPALTSERQRLSAPLHIEHGGRVLEAQTADIAAPGGQTLGWIVLLRDVTAEAQQQRLHAVLVDQMALQDDVHTQDTVMNRRLRSDPVVGEFVREVTRNAAALQKMIVDMQSLTQYSPSHARSRQRVMAVETLLWAVANDWRQIAAAANLTLQVTVQRKGLLIRGDESRLRLAIGNLVDNAIKYTPAGGTITLEIEREGNNELHLRVRDNGVGIHEHDLKRLFTPFYRGTPTDDTGRVLQVPGMGMGLCVARQIIEAHGGRMKVKSRPGAGTAVYLSLPLAVGVATALTGEPFFHEGDTVILNLPQRAV